MDQTWVVGNHSPVIIFVGILVAMMLTYLVYIYCFRKM